MIIVKNSILPVNGFSVIMLFGMLFTRDKTTITERTKRHEKIHIRQWIEITIASVLLITFVVIVFHISPWWWLLSVLIYYILYFLCWIIEIIIPPYNSAYGNICFESEAHYNENNPDYLKHRKPGQFLKYISNKKYPYKK